MNTDKLVRTTFVLDRETSSRLDYIARRMGVSRSTLVRDTLAEPIALMERWMRSVPEDKPITADTAEQLGETMQQDLVAFIERKSAELGHAA